MNDFETIIGLEIHAQLLTESKMFCSCSTDFGAEPNSQVCPVCLGLPGALPVVNRKAVELAILVGLAVGSKINSRSTYARKNYFYPDLPKNYQISQYDAPLCSGGRLELLEEGEKRSIALARIHLEEDAGKSMHLGEPGLDCTLLDFNRCGVPLIEIVTLPELRSPSEAHLFLATLKRVLEYLGASSGNMEEGSLRCDANISIRRAGDERLRAKAEIKNLNSFRNVEKALQYEIERQREAYLKGVTVANETLLWDAENDRAVVMRSKEEAHDYRYFPEPDLLTLEATADWIEELKNRLPELPQEKQMRFMKSYGLPSYDADVLCASREVADYFEQVATVCGDSKLASNWIMTELLRELKAADGRLSALRISAHDLAGLLGLIREGIVSGKMGKEIFADMLASGKSAEQIVHEKKLSQITDRDEMKRIVREVIEENPDPVSLYLKGRQKSFTFLVGQIMKKTSGRANPPIANRVLKEHLESLKGG